MHLKQKLSRIEDELVFLIDGVETLVSADKIKYYVSSLFTIMSIIQNDATKSILRPSSNYIFLRRQSAKGDKHRLICTPYFKEDNIDYSVGVKLLCEAGDSVIKGQDLALLYVNDLNVKLNDEDLKIFEIK